MCVVCRQTPCHPRCPEAPEPPVVYYCVNCGYEIYHGDYYYNIGGDPWCEDCISDLKLVAESDDIGW